MKYLLLGFYFLCPVFCFYAVGQDLPDIESLLEGSEIAVGENGYEEMVTTLQHLWNAPLNINTAGFDSLKMLFLLSDGQIDRLLAFRQKYGNFLHPDELLLVPGIGRRDLENIRPFIRVGNPSLRKRLAAVHRLTRQELIGKARMNVPLQEGYKHYDPDDFDKKQAYERKLKNRFQGPPVGTLLKYKLQWDKRIQWGMTLENDPGEPYFKAGQKTGFDFLSAHFCLMTNGFFRKVIVGDYRLQWGQGLVAWQGFGSGKSGMVVGNEKSGKGVLPYTSTDENNYLRGVAVALQPLESLTAVLFCSGKKTDANLTRTDTIEEEELLQVSLYESGYHRNFSELAKKHVLNEFTAGGSIQWNTPFFKLGGNFLYYDFDPSLLPGDRIYQRYNETGDKRRLFSIDYKTAFRGLYLFGETAFSGQGAWATMNGLRWSNSWWSGNLIYRRYDKRYVSHYASGFGEYSNTSNEEGVYAGLEILPRKKLKIGFYGDWFRFFAPRYRATEPGSGLELLGEVRYSYASWDHQLRVKYEQKPEDASKQGTVDRCKTEYRYQAAYRCSRQWEVRMRLSAMRYRKQERKEWGGMIYQDVIYTSRKEDFKMQYRLGWFRTDSYESRIYAYENNVLYGYSFPAFMGKGWRTYVNLSWKPVKGLTLYLKSGLTVYPEQEKISSGLTEVKGNKLGEMTLQFRLNF